MKSLFCEIFIIYCIFRSVSENFCIDINLSKKKIYQMFKFSYDSYIYVIEWFNCKTFIE